MTILREGYNLDHFKADAMSGLTVAIVALPLSMVLFRGLRARLDSAVGTAVARRRTERSALRARLRGELARTAADRSAALAQARASQAQALAAVHAANIPTVIVTRDCKDGARSGVSEVHSVEHGGRTTVSIRACGDAIARNARAQAIAGIREARHDIMNDQSMSHEVRMKVLTDLDRQIARLRADEN